MRTILIVEDNQGIRALLSQVFARAGFAVRAAEGPEEAMRLCASQCFDIMLSDVVMPGMDGHELARRFAMQCPGGRVVLMSGYDSGCEQCPYDPRCPLMRKPFSPKTAVEYVSAVAGTGQEPT